MVNNKNIEKFMILISIIGNFAFYVQAFKTYYYKDAASLSFISYLISFVTITLWLSYGIYIKNIPLIIGNILGFIGSLIILI